MTEAQHPLAPEHLPYFVVAPGGSDQMLHVVAAVWVVGILLLGGFYFWLHSLPERVAHKRRRTQMELVAVLGIIGLFTHNHMFWIAALLLAMVELPVISGPLSRIADALEALAEWRKRSYAAQVATIKAQRAKAQGQTRQSSGRPRQSAE